MLLCYVEGNLKAPAKFADAFVFKGIECPIKKAIAKGDIVNHAKEAGHTDQGINFLPFEGPVDLNLVIAVDLLCGVL